MRSGTKRAVSIAVVLGAAVIAHAIGNGDIKTVAAVTIVTVTTTTGSGSANATLQNTTSATTYNVLISKDGTCDPLVGFSVPSNPIVSFGPLSTRNVGITCPPRGGPAARRCLFHATNNANQVPLADFVGVCLYGQTPGTLVPQQTSLDFGTVTVGQESELALDIRHAGTLSQTITHVYLQTSDADANFRFAAPCNPDAPSCDAELLAPAHLDDLFSIGIRCSPQSPGMHTAQIFVGTDTFQLLSTPVTVQCIGGATAAPVLAANPPNVAITERIEVGGGSANTIVHLSNPGGAAIVINDVRMVDVDNNAAGDWTYVATGACTGPITSTCSLDPGELLELNVKFDPGAIGRRHATLLISYRDTLDRTKEIALDGIGQGATLLLANPQLTLPFGQVPIGRMGQLDIPLLNTGNRDTVATLGLLPATTPPFTLMSPTMVTITPTAAKLVTVTCAPTTATPSMTFVSATGSDTLSTQPIVVSATCEGTTGELAANPPAVLFGDIRLGGAPVRRTVQLLAAGAPLTLTGQPQLASMSSELSVGTYSSGTTPATFDVTFSPPAGSGAEGTVTTTVLVADTDGDSLVIPVSARIVNPAFDVAPAVELGTFCIGQPTTTSTVSLVSSGTATISLATPTFAASPSPFQLDLAAPMLYPAVIGPSGGAARVAVTPKRQTTVATVSDTLTWHTDLEDRPTADTSVSAQFIDRGGAIAPRALDFGEVTVHLFIENGRRVTIQNCNDTPLQLDPPMVRTPFQIESPNFPSMLDPNETVTFSVGFHPTRTGSVSDVLRITSPQLPGAPLEVTLIGFGTRPDQIGPDGGTGSNGFEDTSFYACSCTGSGPPSQGWPIALAVIVIVRRRRGSSSSR